MTWAHLRLTWKLNLRRRCATFRRKYRNKNVLQASLQDIKKWWKWLENTCCSIRDSQSQFHHTDWINTACMAPPICQIRITKWLVQCFLQNRHHGGVVYTFSSEQEGSGFKPSIWSDSPRVCRLSPGTPDSFCNPKTCKSKLPKL